MKKTLFLLAFTAAAGLAGHAQNGEKAPPKVEEMKFTPPKVEKTEEPKFTPPKVQKKEKATFTPPKIQKSKEPKFTPPTIVKDDELEDFYTRNPSVSRIAWSDEQIVILTLKDNKKEKYNLEDEDEKKAFTDKYGEIPETPPPPPPPPPPTKKVQ